MSAALLCLFDAVSLIVGLGKSFSFGKLFDIYFTYAGYPIWRSYKVVEAKKFDHELI